MSRTMRNSMARGVVALALLITGGLFLAACEQEPPSIKSDPKRMEEFNKQNEGVADVQAKAMEKRQAELAKKKAGGDDATKKPGAAPDAKASASPAAAPAPPAGAPPGPAKSAGQ